MLKCKIATHAANDFGGMSWMQWRSKHACLLSKAHKEKRMSRKCSPAQGEKALSKNSTLCNASFHVNVTTFDVSDVYGKRHFPRGEHLFELYKSLRQDL